MSVAFDFAEAIIRESTALRLVLPEGDCASYDLQGHYEGSWFVIFFDEASV